MWKNGYTYKNGYNGTLEERMAKKTMKAGPDDCWLWTGSCDTSGYACIRVDGKLRHVSHVAFELHNSTPVPKGMLIMHSCDNPPCVNPRHLSLGTKLLNSADKINKGRAKWLKHENHPMAKLTPNDVKKIKATFNEGGHTFTSIGQMFGVTRTAISGIINGKNWI